MNIGRHRDEWQSCSEQRCWNVQRIIIIDVVVAQEMLHHRKLQPRAFC